MSHPPRRLRPPLDDLWEQFAAARRTGASITAIRVRAGDDIDVVGWCQACESPAARIVRAGGGDLWEQIYTICPSCRHYNTFALLAVASSS